MNNITVTIELCAEDRARLDKISGLLEAAKMPNTKKTETASPKQEEPKPVKTEPEQAEPVAQTPAAAPAPAAPAAPEPPKTETVPEVTAAELQSKVVQLVSAGKKEATRAIIMEYAKSVGEIPAEKRAEVLERLNALEG